MKAGQPLWAFREQGAGEEGVQIIRLKKLPLIRRINPSEGH